MLWIYDRYIFLYEFWWPNNTRKHLIGHFNLSLPKLIIESTRVQINFRHYAIILRFHLITKTGTTGMTEYCNPVETKGTAIKHFLIFRWCQSTFISYSLFSFSISQAWIAIFLLLLVFIKCGEGFVFCRLHWMFQRRLLHAGGTQQF